MLSDLFLIRLPSCGVLFPALGPDTAKAIKPCIGLPRDRAPDGWGSYTVLMDLSTSARHT